MSFKKAVYLFLTMILFVMLMSIIHTFLNFWYFYAFATELSQPTLTTFWLFSTYLPVYVPVLLLIAGLISGFFVGMRWWQIVYVEKRHWSFRKKTNRKK